MSYQSVCMVLLTSSGRIDDFVSERINDLRVDESVREESLSASFSLNDCFAS